MSIFVLFVIGISEAESYTLPNTARLVLKIPGVISFQRKYGQMQLNMLL